MKEIITLEIIYGYIFKLEGQCIKYAGGKIQPANVQKVQMLLNEIQRCRDKAIVFLSTRDQPVDMPLHLWNAAEKAELSAHSALTRGDRKLAHRELKRSARLCAAAAKASGALEPHISWNEWVSAFSDEDSIPEAK
ncbi:MAG TPA: hypothetical protein PK078_14720 [Anaerolineales bacterium]|nr:hypothetical protein [Anaerolineales bacterium]